MITYPDDKDSTINYKDSTISYFGINYLEINYLKTNYFLILIQPNINKVMSRASQLSESHIL